MSFKSILAKQFRQPKGLLGIFIGNKMNKINDLMNRWTLESLGIQSKDNVLEIGFGNGKFIAEAAKLASNGFIAGIDFSEIMVKQATKKNSPLIKQGKVDLKFANIQKIPYENDKFEKVFTVNTIYFWPNPKENMEEVYRVIKNQGRFAVVFRTKEYMEKQGTEKDRKGCFTLYTADEVLNLMKTAGFNKIKVLTKNELICVIGTKG